MFTIPTKAIGLLLAAAGLGVNFASGLIEDAKTRRMIEEEVEKQLNERNKEESEDEE